MKLLEDKFGKHLYDLWPGAGQDILNRTQNMLIRKEKIDKLYYIEIKNLGSSKDTTKKAKRQVTEWKRYWQHIHPTNNLHQLQINFSKNKKQTAP